jgi:hypothetical protein
MRSTYVVGDPVMGNNFYGRQKELAHLLQGEGKTAHVLGMRRVGKTSLLWKVAESVPSIYLDFQAMVGQLDLFTRQVAFELKRRHKQYPWLPAPNQENDGFIWLEEATWEAEEQGVTLFLLCDEAEGLLDFDATFLRRLRGLIWGPYRLRTILASAKNLSKLDDLCRQWDTSPFLNNFPPPLYLGGLDDADAAELIRQAQSSTPLPVPDDTISAVKWHTGNHPYLIQWLCYQLWEDKNRNLEAWTVTPVDLQPRDQLARRLQMDFDYLSDPERRILYAVIHKGLPPTDVDPHYVRGLKSLGYIRQEGDSYAIGNAFLERWLESADWKAKSDISSESTLTLYKREGVLSMATPDPAVTAWAIATLSKATDWLFNQAGEILKEWREKRKQEAAAEEPSPPELVPSNQPPVTNADVLLEALQGQAELSARRMEIQQVESLMRQLERHHKKILDYQEKLSSYLDVEVELRLRDRLDEEQSEMARKANKMRQILERLSGKSVIVPGLDE